MAVPQLKSEGQVSASSSSIRVPRVGLDLIGEHATKLSKNLHRQLETAFPPRAQKSFRKLTSGEVAKLLGVADSYLRQLSLDGKGPDVEVQPNGRRLYTLRDVANLRAYLDANAKGERQYLKHRSGSEHLQVIACTNFKGGSAKTTTAAHLAQYLAINGYRVLAIDLDPQASLSAVHGLHPELDVLENQTLYGNIRYTDGRIPLKDIIRPTYIEGLDIIPANLELMEFEHEVPMALQNKQEGKRFFDRVNGALETVHHNYDIVVIDCPPQLGYLTLSALSAATGIVITVHPQMMDVMSMAQFLTMTKDLLSVLKNAGGNTEYDWLKYLVTRYEPNDVPQAQMVQYLRKMFGDFVLDNEMLKSTAVSDAGIMKKTIYEAERADFTKGTIDRAIESMNAVNRDIEKLVLQAWGRI